MTDAVLSKFKQKISQWSMVPSGGGKFEVSVNGKLIFSKLKEGRFPENNEIITLLQKG